jgi:hypothetical protein
MSNLGRRRILRLVTETPHPSQPQAEELGDDEVWELPGPPDGRHLYAVRDDQA